MSEGEGIVESLGQDDNEAQKISIHHWAYIDVWVSWNFCHQNMAVGMHRNNKFASALHIW